MPPQSKKTEGKAIETVDSPVLGHDPKVQVEEPDVKNDPIKTSGAVPATVIAADKIDESITVDTVMVQHPVYGNISLADLEEVLRAEIKAEAAGQDGVGCELPEICEEHFPQGWDSKNAAGQDGVGCEHGSWSRAKAKK